MTRRGAAALQLAFYLWLRHEAKIDALIHLGAHGSLEWLPGKAVGGSGACAPQTARGFEKAQKQHGVAEETEVDRVLDIADHALSIGVYDRLKVPVKLIGVGEKVEDLKDFKPDDFAASLFD